MWKDDDDDEAKRNVEKIEDIKYLFDFVAGKRTPEKRRRAETMWFSL